MNDVIAEYYAALERLKQRRARINNDIVAIEAGRKKGSIKRFRTQFAALIAAIGAANADKTRDNIPNKLVQAEDDAKSLRAQLDAAMVRELSLLRQVFELKKELVQLRGGHVVPIRNTERANGNSA